jgi:hypothetical protein
VKNKSKNDKNTLEKSTSERTRFAWSRVTTSCLIPVRISAFKSAYLYVQRIKLSLPSVHDSALEKKKTKK